MLTAILILTIFNTGMLFFVMGGFTVTQKEIHKAVDRVNYNSDQLTENALTAIYNMDSLKQKAEMSGEVEIP